MPMALGARTGATMETSCPHVKQTGSAVMLTCLPVSSPSRRHHLDPTAGCLLRSGAAEGPGAIVDIPDAGNVLNKTEITHIEGGRRLYEAKPDLGTAGKQRARGSTGQHLNAYCSHLDHIFRYPWRPKRR
jgi:hypothetical protein